MKIFFPFFLFLPVAFAQENVDYNALMEQAMKMQQYANSNIDVRIKRVSGDVKIKSSDSEDFVQIEDNAYYPLEVDDVIKTGSNGYAEIYFEDIGAIKIDRNTEIEVGSLDSSDTNLFLKVGAVISKIQKSVKKKLSLSIKTPTAVCAIRGTEFAVEHSPFNNESIFGVFDEGVITVMPLSDEKASEGLNIEKGNELIISPNSKRYKVTRLSRLSKHRAALIQIRKNINLYRTKWKRLSPEKREYLRNVLLKKKARVEYKKRQVQKNKTKKSKTRKNNFQQ